MNPRDSEEILAGLRSLARDMESPLEAPPRLEASLLSTFRRHRARRAWRRRLLVGTIAASVLLAAASGLAWWRRGPSTPAGATAPVAYRPVPATVERKPEAPSVLASAAHRPRPLRAARRRTAPAAAARPEIATGFFPVTAGGFEEGLDRARLVRVQLPRMPLLSFGLPMNMDRAAEDVTADVLLSEDGVARAIRFVQRATGARRTSKGGLR